jgi:GST-like protein
MTIQAYAFSTPNSVKVPITLEELGLPYELKSVNVRKGEQKNPEFLSLNANGKVPFSLTDQERPTAHLS